MCSHVHLLVSEFFLWQCYIIFSLPSHFTYLQAVALLPLNHNFSLAQVSSDRVSH